MSKTTDRYSAAELQKKYSGKTGYKASANKSMSNSSFWLDDDFAQEKPSMITDRTVRKSVEFVRLAAYQRAVSNFVRIVTGKADIPVVYSSGNDSYTNGKKVVISSKLDEKEFDSSVGLALHEGSHCALTDFELLNKVVFNGLHCNAIYDWYNSKQLPAPAQAQTTNRLKDLINIIEDRRIDRFVYDSAPGYQGYYQALYKRYFNSKEIDQALAAGLKNDAKSWADYIFHICNFANPNRNLKTLPGLKKIWDLIHIPTINRLKSTLDVVKVAVQVHITILECIAEQEALEATIKKQKDFTDGNIEKEPAPKKEKKEKKEPKAESEQKEDLLEDEQGDGDEPADEDADEDLNENLDGPSSMPSEDAEEEAEGESELVSSNSGEASDDPDANGEGETAGEGTSTEDVEEAVEEDVEEEPGMSDKEKEDLLKKIGNKLEKAIKEQQEFLEGKTDKKVLKKQDAQAVNAAAESNASYEYVGGDVVDENGYVHRLGKIKCLVVKGLTESIISSGILGGQVAERGHKYIRKAIESGNLRDYIQEGIALGTMLGKKLKTRDEERSLKTTRLDAGRIDKRLIAELGFGNDRVFAQTMFNTARPSHIHISIDASGSMQGKAWHSAMKTAIAIAKAATMTSSMEVVISVRGSVGNDPLMWTIYDSRTMKLAAVKDRLYAVRADGSTPEGLCFEAILKDIVKDARGKDAYFINLSDGEPGFGSNKYSYSGNVALLHTRNQVNKLRAESINVVSFFITDREDNTWSQYSLKKFQTMYGKDAENINVSSLTHLAKSLNQMFERKA
jgi:hypothetical protein